MSVKVFIVMAPPVESPVDEPGEWEAENMVFVKDGFSLPALIIPELWLIWQRMWIPLLGYLGYRIVIALVALSLGNAASTLTAFVVAILFAMEANNLRRWSLERRGWRIVGESVGRNRSEAELLFFRDWANRSTLRRHPESHAEAQVLEPARTLPAPEPADEEPKVFGLFPEPEPER